MISPNPETEKSTQHLQNKSYDKDNNILAFEMLGYDGSQPVRLATDALGRVKLDAVSVGEVAQDAVSTHEGTYNHANYNTAYGWGNHAGLYDLLGAASTAETNAKSYADGLVVGLLDDRGNYDASVNTFPASGGSGTAGAILKGDLWLISVTGTLGGVAVAIGDQVRALVDTPGQTATNWAIAEANIGYVPENSVNKVTSISGASTDIQYPSAKLLYDQLTGKAPALGADDNYVTDAQLVVISNTSGTNTGDASGHTGLVTTDQTSGQTIGATGARLTKLWATDITCTNAIAGSVTGNAGTVTNGVYTTDTGTVTAKMLQNAAADLGDADITVNLTNSNAGNQTNLTLDGQISLTNKGIICSDGQYIRNNDAASTYNFYMDVSNLTIRRGDGAASGAALNVKGTLDVSSTLTVAGTTTLNGNTVLGNASTDTCTNTGRMILRTLASDPKDATPANRPAGSVAEIAYYNEKMYFCTNAATPTWKLITAS